MLHYLIYALIAFLAYRWLSAWHKKSVMNRPAATWSPADIRPSKRIRVTLRFNYVDANQRRTKRVVNIHSFQNGTPAGMSGYCNLRGETRTFRLDRVQTVIDDQTGEIIENLLDWLETKYAVSPIGIAANLQSKHPHHAPILLHVARADGAMRAPELQVIADLLAPLMSDVGLTIEATKEVLSHFETPAYADFADHAKALAVKNQAQFVLVFRAAQKIVNTQKTIHPNEHLALDLLQQLVRPAPQ